MGRFGESKVTLAKVIPVTGMGRNENYEKKGRFRYALDTLEEFMLATTIHGVRYLVISESWVVKALWGTATVSSTILCAFLINFSVRKWLDHPYVTYVESVPIREVDFPAVTVCPDAWNMDTMPALETFERVIQITNNDKLRRIYTKYMFETFLNNKTKEMNDLVENLYDCLWINGCLSPNRTYTAVCRSCTNRLKSLSAQIKDLVSGVKSLKQLHLEVRQVCHMSNTAKHNYPGVADSSTLSGDLNRPDPRSSTIADLADFLQSNVTTEEEGLMPLDELFDYMVEILMSQEPPPSEEMAKLMAYLALWDCQDWAIIRWLWETVVADESYRDVRIRGAYLLRGDRTQVEALTGLSQVLLDDHPEVYAEIIKVMNLSTKSELQLSAAEFAKAVFRFFVSGPMVNRSVMAVTNFVDAYLESHSYLPACYFDGIETPRVNNSESVYDQILCPFFRTALTDRGYCVTFNRGSYSNTYKNDKPLDGEEDNIGDTRPSHVKHRGFHFYIDSNAIPYGFSTRLATTKFAAEQVRAAIDVQAFQVALHRREHVPTMVGDGYQMEGTEFRSGNTFGVTDINIYFKVDGFNGTDALRSRSPSSRGCVFHDEVDLRFVQNYTKLNCMQECVDRAARKFKGCVLGSVYNIEMSFGHNLSYPVCTLEGNETLEITQGEMRRELNEMAPESRKELLQCETKCLQPCVDVEYDTTFSTSTIDTGYPNDVFYMVSSDDADQLKGTAFTTGGNLKDYLEDEGRVELIAPPLKAAFSLAATQTNAERALLRASQNLARVSVMFSSSTGRIVTRDVSTTFAGALASVGGSLGLCTGFSLLSLCEIFYYIYTVASKKPSKTKRKR